MVPIAILKAKTDNSSTFNWPKCLTVHKIKIRKNVTMYNIPIYLYALKVDWLIITFLVQTLQTIIKRFCKTYELLCRSNEFSIFARF